MPTKMKQPREREWRPGRQFLPMLLGKDKLEESEINKLELFEKGLGKEIKKSDTIDQAITKIVRMALAAEFGPSLVKSKGADRMVKTISAGIMSDPDLRKQALFILDRFAS